LPDGSIDFDQVRSLALEFKPKVNPAKASTEPANTETNDKQAESNITPATSSPETREKVAE